MTTPGTEPQSDQRPNEGAGNGHTKAQATPPPKPPPKPLPIITISDALDDLYACANLPTIETPFTRLNATLGGGLIAAQSVVMPGATGSGKSSLLAAIATHTSSFAPVLIGTYELAARLFVARIAGQVLDQPWLNMVRGRTARATLERAISRGIEILHRPPINVLERAIKTIADREGQAPVVLLDYLQIMMAVSVSDDPRVATAKTSELTRDLAETTKAPILMAAAVSRQNSQVLKQAKSSTSPSDLVGLARDVSNIEYDAAAVLALAVADEVDEQTGMRRGLMAVSKNRFGPLDMIGLEFHVRSGRWFESSISLEPTEDEVLDMRAQILGSLRKATVPLSKNRIIERDGKRWVTGRKQDVLRLIDDLVDEGLVQAVGQCFLIRSNQESLLS
jgi:predicted ATPase